MSVRSGARASMPGMMDTILNLGMNDETVKIVKKSGNEAFCLGFVPSICSNVWRCGFGC
jgi:phosphoenolpyruvate synthase/pyruvate phosphate dikinase